MPILNLAVQGSDGQGLGFFFLVTDGDDQGHIG